MPGRMPRKASLKTPRRIASRKPVKVELAAVKNFSTGAVTLMLKQKALAYAKGRGYCEVIPEAQYYEELRKKGRDPNWSFREEY